MRRRLTVFAAGLAGGFGLGVTVPLLIVFDLCGPPTIPPPHYVRYVVVGVAALVVLLFAATLLAPDSD